MSYTDDDFIATYVPEAEHLSYDQAVSIADQRDAEAADQLRSDFEQEDSSEKK